MNDLISHEFENLETSKRNILEKLRSHTSEELTKSLPGKWCMIQAMRHVQMSESGSLGYMKKKSQAGDGMKKRPFQPRALLQLLYLVFFLRIKFKAPEVIASPKITSLDELESDWNESRKSLKEFLENYPEKWESKAVYRHPFVGLLNLTDGLRFLNAHLKHHMRQVSRIERQIKKPHAGGNT